MLAILGVSTCRHVSVTLRRLTEVWLRTIRSGVQTSWGSARKSNKVCWMSNADPVPVRTKLIFLSVIWDGRRGRGRRCINLHSRDNNQAKTNTMAVKNPAVAENAQVDQGNPDFTFGWKAIGASRRVRPRWTAPTIYWKRKTLEIWMASRITSETEMINEVLNFLICW